MTTHYSTLISASELKNIINHPQLRLFDCRFNLMDESHGFELYKQAHIENSQYADLNKQLASPVMANSGRHPLPDKDNFENQLRQWGVDANSQIVVYDDAFGAIAARLWWLCKWAGLTNVAVLDGGLKTWQADQYPLSTKPVSFNASAFQANFNDELWVSTKIIEKLINDCTTLITDARAAKRYLGESEPIDKRAGHIPSAHNFAFENNLDSHGNFLSPEQLANMHQQATEITQVISMCGSGVTACHNILARAHAGLNPGQLYVGSWSEWIVDPGRKIETGNSEPNI